MSIILEHRISNKRYVLLGPAFGMAESAHPDPWVGGLKAIRESSSCRLLAIADDEGDIDWVDPKEYRVVSVSGLLPKEAIQASFEKN